MSAISRLAFFRCFGLITFYYRLCASFQFHHILPLLLLLLPHMHRNQKAKFPTGPIICRILPPTKATKAGKWSGDAILHQDDDGSSTRSRSLSSSNTHRGSNCNKTVHLRPWFLNYRDCNIILSLVSEEKVNKIHILVIFLLE